MSCKCIFNPPPESIEGTVSKQGKLYARLSFSYIDRGFDGSSRGRRYVQWTITEKERMGTDK